MTNYSHPLPTEADERDTDDTFDMTNVDVRVSMSPDGKRATVWANFRNREERTEHKFKLGGVQINGTDIRTGELLELQGVDLEIGWHAGGLGAYPGANIKVTA